jgi:histidine triad (HIT) family protein
MSDCLFCNFASNSEIAKVLDNDLVYAINDINPQAPTHILLIPKLHAPNAAELALADQPSIGALFLAVADLAKELKLESYRTVFNTGAGAGQSVFHAHLHLLAGREFAWPAG